MSRIRRKGRRALWGERLPFTSHAQKRIPEQNLLTIPTPPCINVTRGHPCHGIRIEEEEENGEPKLLQFYSMFVRHGFKSW
jgi:hypothetical protein